MSNSDIAAFSMDSVEKKEETNETSTPKTAETKETKPVVPEHDPQASGALIVYQENPIPQQSNALKDAGSWLKDYCTAVKHGRYAVTVQFFVRFHKVGRLL